MKCQIDFASCASLLACDSANLAYELSYLSVYNGPLMLLLHLSDIHFRLEEVGSSLDPNSHLRNELLLDVEKMCSRLGVAPEAVLVSGDVAFQAHVEEYAFALSWLELLCNRCGTTASSVFVIPGNHDVSRGVSSRAVVQALHRDIKATNEIALDSKLRGLLIDPETRRMLYESIENYNLFAGQFFCDLLPPGRSVAIRDLTLNDGSILRLAGLNSTFVSSAADKSGDLFVDPAHLQLLRMRGVEHLVMCHHPYSWLRQGDNLLNHLSSVARIHLFGHEHTNRIELTRDWVRIAASAAHPDRTDPGWEPGYNLIEANVRGTGVDRYLEVTIHVRIWQRRPDQFRPKMDGDNDAFRHQIKLDSWLPTAIEKSDGAVFDERASPIDLEMPLVSTRREPMDALREISIRFFKLTLSQKSVIAGKLNLIENEDMNQPDFERFRRVFIRARERGLVAALDREVLAMTTSGHQNANDKGV